MWIKVVVFPLMYLVPFGLLLTNWFSDNLWSFYGLWLFMALGVAGCGLGIMHDACHGSISTKKSVNDLIGKVLNLIGGYVLNWKIQHNILHHTYTNIDGHDEDIDLEGLMRFSPNQPVRFYYRFQAIYAWFLYGFMTTTWVIYKDFLRLIDYHKKGLLKMQNARFGVEMFKLTIQKILYFATFIVLPIIVLDVAWWHVILGWLSMHFVVGLILTTVFTPAHVVPSSDFSQPDEENKVHTDWARHQMLNTSNFAPKSRIFSWYVGGLNYQIEHHLFPNICHVHHRKISKIVKKTAEEFNLPYYSQPTFLAALISHAKMLHKLRK
ncbi:MAG: acyl-CoA desaturase [Bacteroidetes bacterium]|nr:acyl-CoA desaturase [Bacteroidota bacterium]